MIIKGSARGATRADGIKLAKHLISTENETVSVIAMEGVASTDLTAAIEEMRLLSVGSRGRHGLYHASINLDRCEAPVLAYEQWLEAVAELGRRLGLEGHAHVVVAHVKHQRPHLHVVWSRVHPVTLKLGRDSHNYRIHEQTSRHLEEKWRLRAVDGAFTRKRGTPRPVAAATHADWQASERTGIRVTDVADKLKQAWTSATTAAAFQRALAAEGWQLCRGRRGVVLIDHAGTPHSIPRRLGLKAAVVHKKLAALNLASLPTVEKAKQTRRNVMPRTQYGAARRRRGDRAPAPAPVPLSPEWWQKLGYEVESFADHLAVKLSPITTLLDHGDRLVLDRAGEPTDEEIRLLVTAGRERGWTEIRFFGGSADFQKRARLEALRQGYRLDQISLECEDGKPRPLSAAPMPDHIKAKLLPPAPEPTPAALPPEAPAPAPTLEYRP